MDLREKFEDAILDASGRINDSTEWRSDYLCKPTVMEDLLDKLTCHVGVEFSGQFSGLVMAIDHWSKQAGEKVTCVDCLCRFTCEFAWDPYNTDGDCLAEK